MEAISAQDKVGDRTVTVHRGLTKDGEEQVEISVYRISSRLGSVTSESMSFDISEFMALITVVQKLRDTIMHHPLSKA